MAMAGAPPGSWAEVDGLGQNKPIAVTTTGGKTVHGLFVGVSATVLKVRESSGETTIPKADVVRVEVKSSDVRTRHTLIGAGIGLGLGLALDLTLGAFLRNETGQGDTVRAATVVVPTAALAGIGALIPANKVIYRAPKTRH